MTKRTVGERLAGNFLFHSPEAHKETVAIAIDRAIRREKAKAWDERDKTGWTLDGRPPQNPYRGRAKR